MPCMFLNTYMSDLLISRHMRLCFSICPGLSTTGYATSRVHPQGCTSWLLYAGGSISIYFWTHIRIYKNCKTKCSSNSNYEKSEWKQVLIKLNTKTHTEFTLKILSPLYMHQKTKCCKMDLLVYFGKENPKCVPELLDRKYMESSHQMIRSQACNLNGFTSQRVSPTQIKQQKSSDACRDRRTSHLLPYSEMPCAPQVSQTKSAVRLPTDIQPGCVQADPQISSFQQRKVEKL